MIHLNKKYRLNVVMFLFLVTSCTNIEGSSILFSSTGFSSFSSISNESSSSPGTTSKSISNSTSATESSTNSISNSMTTSASSSAFVSSSSSNNVFTPALEEFRYTGQDWRLSIRNANLNPIPLGQYFVQEPETNQITIGMTDAIGFTENSHGGRMLRSLNSYYPEVGIEALSYNGSLINNPNFYNETDYRRKGNYVDLLDQQGTFNFYTMAMFAEAHSEEIGPKIFLSASTSGVSFTSAQLNYDAYAAAAWRIVPSKFSYDIPVALHSYQMARWLELYGAKHEILYLAALENDFINSQKQAISCNDQAPTEGENVICGGETDAIIRTGYGLENSLFVGNYKPSLNKIQGWALGRYMDHTIYSSENSIDDSNSHTVPTVSAFLATLISLRRLANLPELTARQWKQLILSTADQVVANHLSEINSLGTIVITPLTRYIHVLNKDNAIACAINGLCIQ